MGFGTGGQPRDFCGDGVIALRRGATNIFALFVASAMQDLFRARDSSTGGTFTEDSSNIQQAIIIELHVVA
jgi:hypothetical protein